MSKLIVKSGGATREISLSKETFSIGRTPENDLEVKDSYGDSDSDYLEITVE